MEKGEELKLIARVRKGDSQALKKLFVNYQPLVDNCRRQFYLTDYDACDWKQEALIVCYESALLYDPARRRPFGALFKIRLRHRFINLCRYAQALKRRSQRGLQPLCDEDAEEESNIYYQEVIPVWFMAEEALSQLSKLELQAFLVLLGVKEKSEVCASCQVAEKGLNRAKYRAIQKIRENFTSKK